jgi:hypothetical protein
MHLSAAAFFRSRMSHGMATVRAMPKVTTAMKIFAEVLDMGFACHLTKNKRLVLQPIILIFVKSQSRSELVEWILGNVPGQQMIPPISQRDSITQPGVARHALSWVIARKKFPTATRLRAMQTATIPFSSAHQRPQPR